MNIKNGQTPSGALDPGPFYHSTKADLKLGDLLEHGYSSNEPPFAPKSPEYLEKLFLLVLSNTLSMVFMNTIQNYFSNEYDCYT